MSRPHLVKITSTYPSLNGSDEARELVSTGALVRYPNNGHIGILTCAHSIIHQEDQEHLEMGPNGLYINFENVAPDLTFEFYKPSPHCICPKYNLKAFYYSSEADLALIEIDINGIPESCRDEAIELKRARDIKRQTATVQWFEPLFVTGEIGHTFEQHFNKVQAIQITIGKDNIYHGQSGAPILLEHTDFPRYIGVISFRTKINEQIGYLIPTEEIWKMIPELKPRYKYFPDDGGKRVFALFDNKTGESDKFQKVLKRIKLDKIGQKKFDLNVVECYEYDQLINEQEFREIWKESEYILFGCEKTDFFFLINRLKPLITKLNKQYPRGLLALNFSSTTAEIKDQFGDELNNLVVYPGLLKYKSKPDINFNEWLLKDPTGYNHGFIYDQFLNYLSTDFLSITEELERSILQKFDFVEPVERCKYPLYQGRANNCKCYIFLIEGTEGSGIKILIQRILFETLKILFGDPEKPMNEFRTLRASTANSKEDVEQLWLQHQADKQIQKLEDSVKDIFSNDKNSRYVFDFEGIASKEENGVEAVNDFLNSLSQKIDHLGSELKDRKDNPMFLFLVNEEADQILLQGDIEVDGAHVKLISLQLFQKEEDSTKLAKQVEEWQEDFNKQVAEKISVAEITLDTSKEKEVYQYIDEIGEHFGTEKLKERILQLK